MKLLSITKIHKEIEQIITINPRGTLFGVIGNDYSGFEHLSSLFSESINKRTKHQIFRLNSIILKDIKRFDSFLKSTALNEFDEKIDDNPIDHSDAIFNFLKICSKTKLKTVVFIIEKFELLEIDSQYNISAQFRNIREKLKISDINIGFHVLIIGKYSALTIEKYCNQYGTSTIFDNLYYVSKPSFPEAKELLNTPDDMDVKLKLCYEYCNGDIELIEILKSNLDENPNEREAVKNVFLKKDFVESFEKNYTILNKNQKSLIVDMLNGFEIKNKFNKSVEELYLSGCVSIRKEKEFFIMSIRNWIYENALRLKIENSIYKNSDEILPPVLANNLSGYVKILQIENKIKNIILFELSKYNYNKHPLELLDILGEICNNKKVYDYCKFQRKEMREKYKIKTPNTLISFLSISNLQVILHSKEIIGKSNHKFIDVFSKYFSSDLNSLLSKLRNLRNPIAHSSIIDTIVLSEIDKIEKNIFENIQELGSA